MTSYDALAISKAKGCLERAYSAIYEASQYPYSRVNQCPMLVKAVEAEIEAAVCLIAKSKLVA